MAHSTVSLRSIARLPCWLIALVMAVGVLSGCAQGKLQQATPLQDPHVWLEAPVDSAAVSEWLTQQVIETQDWRRQQSHYAHTRDQLRAAWAHARWRVVAVINDQVFFYYNPGMDDHYGLYQQSYTDFLDSRNGLVQPGASARLLISADSFSEDTRPGDISLSPDGQWLAFQISHRTASGSERRLWYLQSLARPGSEPVTVGVDHESWNLPAELLAWADDGTLFFTVSAPTDTNLRGWQSRVYQLSGRIDESVPVLIHSETDGGQIEQLYVTVQYPDAGVSQRDQDRNLLLAVAAAPDMKPGGLAARWRELALNAGGAMPGRLPLGQDKARYVGTVPNGYVFITDGVRGTGAITVANARRATTLIPESDAPLLSARVVGHRLVLEYLVHGSSTLRLVDLGNMDDLEMGDVDGMTQAASLLMLPAPVRIDDLRAFNARQLLVSYSGILTPPRSELIDLHSGSRVMLTQNRPPIDLTRYRAHLARVQSHDGTRVPVWVADSHAGQGSDVSTLLLEVYGGFAVPMETAFSISRLAWLASGGAYAVAGPRGGGDYGEHWHRDGSGEHRHNSVADVVAVADWLHSEWLADGDKLAISGRSHGGLLAAEVVNQSPGLFAALVTDAAVFDLVRLGALGGAEFWQQEYAGSTLSPYHRVLTATETLAAHPPALLVTRVNDPVVAPAHSFKYLQALQAGGDQGQPPAFLHIAPGKGHDTSGAADALIDDYALRWTFLTSDLVTQ